MRDFARLREHLRVALACAPLVAGAGTACSKQHTPSGDASKVVAKTPPKSTPDAAPAEIGPGPDMHMPSCPSGKWCGPGADVKGYASSDATQVMGCTTPLSHEGVKGAPQGWPGAEGIQIYMTLDEAATKAKRDAKDATTCCYDWSNPCPGGRPLVDGDRAIVAAPVIGVAAVAADPALAHLPPALRHALAEAWIADALAEHASIASFARSTIELMAAGAPAELLAANQRAGLDEVRHAERCFALASRYAGRAIAPGALPAVMPRGGDLARLARDTFIEGGVGETVATLCATRALAGCRDAQVAATLRGIVKDETRHAALAWRTIAWTIAEGGAPVIAALHEAARTLRPAPAPAVAPDAALGAHGRLDPAAQRAAAHDAWEHIILPTFAQLTGATSRGLPVWG